MNLPLNSNFWTLVGRFRLSLPDCKHVFAGHVQPATIAVPLFGYSFVNGFGWNVRGFRQKNGKTQP